MRIIRDSENNWIEGKEDLNYKKKVLIENIPKSINLIQRVIIPKKGKIPIHAHKQTSEVFYICNGFLKILGKEETILKKGDIVFVEKEEDHGFINDGNEDIEMLVFKINFEKGDEILRKR